MYLALVLMGGVLPWGVDGCCFGVLTNVYLFEAAD